MSQRVAWMEPAHPAIEFALRVYGRNPGLLARHRVPNSPDSAALHPGYVKGLLHV